MSYIYLFLTLYNNNGKCNGLYNEIRRIAAILFGTLNPCIHTYAVLYLLLDSYCTSFNKHCLSCSLQVMLVVFC